MTVQTVTIGLRTKTAKAIAIALNGQPQFVQRWNLELWDRSVPETGQPHHEVMELPWARAQVEVKRWEKLIEDCATERLRSMLDELQASGWRVASIGVVGSPDRNLDKIGNPHIRAHAAEGVLYRRAIETAAARCRLTCRTFSDRDLDSTKLKSVLATIGAQAGRPWRAEERAAATAAWIVHAKKA
jgi:hypothetical protein